MYKVDVNEILMLVNIAKLLIGLCLIIIFAPMFYAIYLSLKKKSPPIFINGKEHGNKEGDY